MAGKVALAAFLVEVARIERDVPHVRVNAVEEACVLDCADCCGKSAPAACCAAPMREATAKRAMLTNIPVRYIFFVIGLFF